MHVDGFGLIFYDGGVDDAVGSAAISSDESWRLWMTNFGKYCSHWYGKLGVHVESSNFCFRG